MIDVRIKLGFDREWSELVIMEAETGEVLKEIVLSDADDYCVEMERAHKRYNIIEGPDQS